MEFIQKRNVCMCLYFEYDQKKAQVAIDNSLIDSKILKLETFYSKINSRTREALIR